MERTEKVGLGIAAAGHVLLFGALSIGFLATPNPLKLASKPIDISLVDEVALESAAPASEEAPAPSQAPDTGPPEDAPPPAEAVAMPEPAPAPPVARPAPAPPPKPAPVAKPQPPKPAPPKPAPPKPAPAKPVPKAATATPAPKATPKAIAKPAAPAELKAGSDAAATKPRPRGSLLGDDFRKSSAMTTEHGTAQAPRAAAASAAAVAGLGDAIARQVQPCANRIPNPGPGANLIRSKLRLRMNPDGTLAARPALTGQTGVNDGNERYAQRVGELAAAAIIQCAPYKLPDELYEGGWKDIIINYRLPG